MSYYRLRDIKTPPFAYVINKDEVVHTCDQCQLPFPAPQGKLAIEIFTPETDNWGTRLAGKPMMAEEWLIGDESFKAMLDKHFPNLYHHEEVTIVSWMSRQPSLLATEPEDLLSKYTPTQQPSYYYFRPKHLVSLDVSLLEDFPPIHCHTCGRDIPEIPLEYQRLPDLSGFQPAVASLEHFHLEGYDYLFHEKVLEIVKQQFPQMMLEKLVCEPLSQTGRFTG